MSDSGQCFYCGGAYPSPVSYHHTQDECDVERAKFLDQAFRDAQQNMLNAEGAERARIVNVLQAVKHLLRVGSPAAVAIARNSVDTLLRTLEPQAVVSGTPLENVEAK